MGYENIPDSGNFKTNVLIPLKRMLQELYNIGYTGGSFSGTAQPADNPSPTQPTFWLAGPGTYTNFGGEVISANKIGFLTYDGSAYSSLEVDVDTTIDDSGLSGYLTGITTLQGLANKLDTLDLSTKSDLNMSEAQAIQLLRLHNPDLVFQGFTHTISVPFPLTENHAWIADQNGGTGLEAIMGIDNVTKGQVIAVRSGSLVAEDLGKAIKSIYVNSNFQWTERVDFANHYESQLIPIAPDLDYYIKGNIVNNASTPTWYDIDQNSLGYITISNDITTAPAGAYYIKLKCYNSSNLANYKFYPLNDDQVFLAKITELKRTDNKIETLKSALGYTGAHENLINQATIVVDKGFDGSGYFSNNTYSYAHINVTPGEEYAIKTLSHVRVAFFVDDQAATPVKYYQHGKKVGLYKVPAGCSFMAVLTEIANINLQVTITKGNVVRSATTLDYYAASSENNYFQLVQFIKSALKGNNIMADPYLKGEISFDTYLNLNGGTTTVYPYSFYAHFGTKPANTPKITDAQLGESIRLYGTRSANGYGFFYFGIPAQLLQEKGYKVGDKLKLGFYVREEAINYNLGLGLEYLGASRNIVDNNVCWFESDEKEITDINDPLIWQIYHISSAAGDYDTRISKFCVKNVTQNGAWRGFEENEERIIKEKVEAATGDSITPQIEAVIDDKKTIILDEASQQNYGYGLVNIRRKLRTMSETWGKPKSSINIAIFADSIFRSGTLLSLVTDYFNTTFGIPVENINADCCYGGYETWAYTPCIDSIVKPNVDLFIFSDVPGAEMRDQIVAKVRSETNADILIGTWTLQEVGLRVRYNSVVDMCKKYGCELLDINGILYRHATDGDLAQYMTGVHLTSLGSDLIFADFKQHFENDRYWNEYQNGDIREKIIHLGSELNMPLNSAVTFSGTWAADGAYGVKAVSTQNGAYLEFTFTGKGFELLFDDPAATCDHAVLIDSVAPSTLNLEYCTQIIGKSQTDATWYFHRFFAAYVDTPFMLESEDSVEFEITVDSIARDGSNNITSLEYTLRQGTTVLGTGDIMNDATFTFRTTGQIRIPATVYGNKNFIEMPSGDPNNPGSGYIFNVGDTMQFFAKKTWRDSIDSNTDQFLRIAGLSHGQHTVRITKQDTGETRMKYLSLYL